MNVASLENCKELYELSGWETGDSPDCWYWKKQSFARHVCPAYNLGFLLRKLPYSHKGVNLELVPRFDGTWFIGYAAGKEFLATDPQDKYLWAEADTPENATCKLAIELFKQGVLTK